MIRLQEAPIDTAVLLAAVADGGDGAISLFLGTVRNVNGGKPVSFLEYEAYAGMAEREMERIASEAQRQGASRVAIVHRVGRLEIGEVSVAIAVAAPHRAEAMAACRHAIEALKASVPIWKREHFTDGSIVWTGQKGSVP